VISGFLPVDKAASWTSHDVVAKVRAIVGQRRVGHAGTLDPLATGLLVLGVGKATRLLRFVQSCEKEYVARVVFGVTTDTLDGDGAILHREPMCFEASDLVNIVGRFIGVIAQVPPMVSAVKVGGTRLYELARSGREVERAARTVEVYDIDVLDFAPGPYPEATLQIRCGSGTYVRSLAADIGQALGGGAHVGALRRTRIGWMDVDRDGLAIEELLVSDPERLVVSMARGLAHLPSVQVGDEMAEAVGHGRRFSIDTFDSTGETAVLDTNGELLAVYGLRELMWCPEVVVA
jgi:tRNA pseudouridine55 synthase